MPSVCIYFQVHQPYRMRHFHVFDIGAHTPEYFDLEINRSICKKVAEKCYLPANELMLKLIKKHKGDFRIAYSLSGVVIEQFAEYCPEVLESFQKLVATGHVELLTETYYHSLAALFNPIEFKEQVREHERTVKKYFGVKPTTFRNTELIYSDGIAKQVEALGYKTMLTEGADHVLGWKSPNYVYTAAESPGVSLLLKNYKLSDDIAFRFSQKSWEGYPLTAEKFAGWVHAIDGSGDTVNLFMDYETIGEHQWADTGIFTFFEQLPAAILSHPSFSFATPSEVVKNNPPIASMSIPDTISWADTERDLSAWLGNPMQDNAIAWVYQFDDELRQLKDASLLKAWRKLQTSDHFYYMCTKYWSDGDVHKYFSVYSRPHDAYVIMSNVLTDLKMRIEDAQKKQ